MSETIPITLDGERYSCRILEHMRVKWSNERTNMVPSPATTHKLNRQLLEQNAEELIAQWSREISVTCGRRDQAWERILLLDRCNRWLRPIGASEEDFARLGLHELIDSTRWLPFLRTPLTYLGYRVGKTGLSELKRREILEKAVKESLPNVGDPEYMMSWGMAGTCTRVEAIIQRLISNARTEQARVRDVTAAIRDWEADISWLRAKFSNILESKQS